MRSLVQGDREQLERLATIGEVAAEAAHELRNALAVIAASAYVLKTARDGDPNVAKIERHARTAQGVVDALMALARGEAVRGEDVALAEVIAEARADLPAQAQWLDELGEARVKGNPVLLARVFRALYDNAVQVAAPRTPTVTTRAVRTDRLVVTVSDDGPGVPGALREHLFDALVSGREGGTGLGLALARRIAIAHRGTLELLPGEGGARFQLTLPA